MNCVVLVGFPGCGKTTIGKKLASHLGFQFYDLDNEIENHYCISILDFFKKYGETYFRICEHQILLSLLNKNNVVIATGGGAPCYFASMQLIHTYAISIYICLSPKSLVERLFYSKKMRPLIFGSDIHSLTKYVFSSFLSREKFYKQATITVKGENLSIPFLTDKVQRLLDNSL